MRFRYPTREERIRAKEQWHDWFAWHPVRIGGGADIAWLETIQRKGILVDQAYEAPYWKWFYKVKE